MYYGNNVVVCLEACRMIQKELVSMEQLSPRTYGEFLAKKKRKKKKGGK